MRGPCRYVREPEIAWWRSRVRPNYSAHHVPIPRIVLAGALTTSVALAGCGGSGTSSPGSTSASPPAAATPIANTTAITSPLTRAVSARAQYARFARAVNLRAGDVPGFVAEPRRERVHPRNKAFEDESRYRRCFAVGKQSKPLSKARSEKFARGVGLHTESVSSEIDIAPTPLSARRDLALASSALSSPTSRRCLARAFDSLGAQNQAIQVGKGRVRGSIRITVGNLRITPLSLGSITQNTDGGFGSNVAMSVTYTISVRGRTVTVPTSLQLDGLAVLVGRSEVTLSTVTLGGSFPPELEARLFSLLVSRALAAGRAYPRIQR
jgi:hypothetical protein